MVNLAILYEKGKGIGHSLPDAYAWYKAAAERGDPEAKRRAEWLAQHLGADDRRRAEALAVGVSAAIRAPAPGSPS